VWSGEKIRDANYSRRFRQDDPDYYVPSILLRFRVSAY
jgi:hypothetical protein